MFAFARQLWVFVRPHQRRLFAGLAFGVLAGLASALLVVSLRWVLNLAFTTPDARADTPVAPLARAVFAVPAVMLARGLCAWLNALLTQDAAARAVMDLRLRLFDHLLAQPPGFFDQARSGELVSRITSDTVVLHTTLGSSLSTLLKAPATLVALAAVLLAQQPKLAAVVLLVLPLGVAPTLYFGRKLRRSATDLQTEGARWAGFMQEAFTGQRVVKAYGLEPMVLARCRAHARACLAHLRRVVQGTETPQQTLEIFGSVGVVLALWLALRSGETLRVGDVFQFVAGVYLMYGPARTLSRLHSQFEQARAASGRVFELLATPGAPPPPSPAAPLRVAGGGDRL
jgi:ABC-type multidrug transport system fused ATPase/permease subunit